MRTENRYVLVARTRHFGQYNWHGVVRGSNCRLVRAHCPVGSIPTVSPLHFLSGDVRMYAKKFFLSTCACSKGIYTFGPPRKVYLPCLYVLALAISTPPGSRSGSALVLGDTDDSLASRVEEEFGGGVPPMGASAASAASATSLRCSGCSGSRRRRPGWGRAGAGCLWVNRATVPKATWVANGIRSLLGASYCIGASRAGSASRRVRGTKSDLS